MEKSFWDFLGNLLLHLPDILYGGFGLGLIGYGLFRVAKIYSCTDLIDGYCAEKERRMKFRRNELHCIFSYRYEGKDYYSKSKYGLSTSLFNYMEKGDKHLIYVNPKKPELFVIERKITLNEVVTMGIGLFLVAAAVYNAVK